MRFLLAAATVISLAIVGVLVGFNRGPDDDLAIATQVSEDGLRLLTASTDYSGLAADTGTLAYLDDAQCFTLRKVGGDPNSEVTHDLPISNTLIVWPEGTTAVRDGSEIKVTVPGGKAFRTGDRIVVGGGGVLPPYAKDIAAAGPCITEGAFIAAEVHSRAAWDEMLEAKKRLWQ